MNNSYYVLKREQVYHAYTITLQLINKINDDFWNPACKLCTKSAVAFCATEKINLCAEHDKERHPAYTPQVKKHLSVKLLVHTPDNKR